MMRCIKFVYVMIDSATHRRILVLIQCNDWFRQTKAWQGTVPFCTAAHVKQTRIELHRRRNDFLQDSHELPMNLTECECQCHCEGLFTAHKLNWTPVWMVRNTCCELINRAPVVLVSLQPINKNWPIYRRAWPVNTSCYVQIPLDGFDQTFSETWSQARTSLAGPAW